MPTKPRPIHSLHKRLRETPDESEPSYSYEETSFMAEREDAVEDEFHRRFAAGTSRGSGGSGTGPSPATGRSSFWRTEASPQYQARGTTAMSGSGGSRENLASAGLKSSGSSGDKLSSKRGGLRASGGSSDSLNNKSGKSRSRGGMMGRLMGGGRKNKNATFAVNGPKRERNTSGGLLGAALQLHSQGSRNSSRGSARNQSVASDQVRA